VTEEHAGHCELRLKNAISFISLQGFARRVISLPPGIVAPHSRRHSRVRKALFPLDVQRFAALPEPGSLLFIGLNFDENLVM
jgi:hypothetical protein